MKHRKSHLVRNVLVLAFAVLFTAGVIVATPPIFFFNVTVSGVAASSGHASGVAFVDENGLPYTAPVDAGSYSISLQNGHDYLVYVVDAAGGNCSAGSLNLNTLGWAQTFDVSC